MGIFGGLLLPVGLVLVFFLLAVGRKGVGWVTGRGSRRRGLGAVATEELHALLYPGKRVQLEQRRVELVLREDEHDGAPRRTGIDLDGGTARIRRAGE
jgi:hypothetical protein